MSHVDICPYLSTFVYTCLNNCLVVSCCFWVSSHIFCILLLLPRTASQRVLLGRCVRAVDGCSGVGLVIPIALLLRCVFDDWIALGKFEASALMLELFFAMVARRGKRRHRQTLRQTMTKLLTWIEAVTPGGSPGDSLILYHSSAYQRAYDLLWLVMILGTRYQQRYQPSQSPGFDHPGHCLHPVWRSETESHLTSEDICLLLLKQW